MGSRDSAVRSKSSLHSAGMDIPPGLRPTPLSLGRVGLPKDIFYRAWPQDVRQTVFGEKNFVRFDNYGPFSSSNLFTFVLFRGYVKNQQITTPNQRLKPTRTGSLTGSCW